MPITASNPAVTPAGERTLRHAILLAWVAGDLDDAGVHEYSELALHTIASHAITPADWRRAGRNLVNLLSPVAHCRPFHAVKRS